MNIDYLWGRLSSDGHYVTEFGRSGVTIQDLIAGTGVSLPNNVVLFWPMLSGNGHYIVVLDALTSGGSINVHCR